jgi:BlaI family penicillinase repressor
MLSDAILASTAGVVYHFARMSKKPKTRAPAPTNGELEILDALWALGPATVRDVYERLERRNEIGYTTVLKLLQNMNEKGLVHRLAEQRSHVYSAAYKRDDIVQQVTNGFVDRVFSGSRSQLVLHALRDESLSADEIAEIRKALDLLKARER